MTMDRPRDQQASSRRRWHILVWLLIVLISTAVVFGWLWTRSSKFLDKDNLVIATVERGTLRILVEGVGRLRPVAERWITCGTTGTVDQVLVRPGQIVEAGAALAILVNPEVHKIAERAELALAEAQANHQILLATVANRRLTAEAQLADRQAAYDEVLLRLEAETKLLERQTISQVDYRRTVIRTEQARVNLDIERRRLDELENIWVAEQDASNAKLNIRNVESQRALDAVDALTVRTEIDGIVHDVLVEHGQQVEIGRPIAKIANSQELIGEIQVPASHARRVTSGQHILATVLSTPTPGIVTRVAPEASDDSVTVNLRFKGPLPRGARPDLSIRAKITVTELDDVLHVRRPLYATEDSTADVFKVTEEGNSAVRSAVRFGIGTLDRIQVVDGLEEGDMLVLGNLAESSTAHEMHFR